MTYQAKLLASAASALVFTALAGQAAAATAAPAPAADNPDAVAPVTVTATREAADLQKVPLAVSALGGQTLEVIASGGDDVRMLSARVPSLTLESSFGRTFPRPYIRGLGNTDFDLNASQPVSFVYDDVVLENPILKGFPLFDIDQVEVLRGPQGTLFGRNTPAGVLKFDSVKPSKDVKGYAQVSYASLGTVNAEGAVGGPITDGVLYGRISGLYQHRNNWITNDFDGQKEAGGYDEYAIRGQLLWTPTEHFSALLNLHHMKLNGSPQIFRANIIQPGTDEIVPGFRRDHIFQNAASRSFQHVNASGAVLNMTYDFGGGMKLTSITAYEHAHTLSHGDIDGGAPSGPGFIPFQSESADGLPKHHQISQEVRLAGDAGPVHYQVGGFYFYESVNINSFDYDGTGALDGYAWQHQITKSWALFGTATYHVTDKFNVTAGIRYTNDQKNFEADRITSPFGAPTTGVLRTNPKSDDVSFNVSADYQVTDDVSIYGRIAKGYRAPSIQGRLLFGDSISVAGKETLYSYELGLKSYLFDHRLRANLAAFDYQVDNLQVTAVGGSANFNRLLNAKHAQGYGFEADLEAKPVSHLAMTAGISYNHTELQDPNLATAPCGSPFYLCTVRDPAGALAGTVNINGNSLPNAPRWIASVTARYGIPYGDGEFFAFTDWSYRSRTNFFLYDSAEFQSPNRVEGGLRIGYSYKGGQWEAAVFGRNITNDVSLEGAIDFDNLTGFVNDPRTWGFELKTKF
ncbi:MAG: TonB-dependent receptor [Proteobacteria bacterium]|nr:TonB-dependent receptor [Pseudomonadota bacterium]